ncbi:MAG: hypothetical protein ACN4A7_08210 [Thermacetogeniaceae bacterium]
MLKKRRLLVITLLLTFITFIAIPIGVYASPTQDEPQIVFQKNEITDQNILFDGAKRSISDIGHSKINSKANIKDYRGNVEEIDTYSTTRHLKTLEYSDGTIYDYYVTTVFVVIPAANSDSNYFSK